MNSRVTLIDEDFVNSRLVGLLLTDAGYETATFADGAKACAELSETGTDLVIIGVEPDDPDGFTLIKELRAQGYRGPVIFVSGTNTIACKLEAFRVGADDFIVKPFEPLELLARVESVLRRFRIADQYMNGTVVRVSDSELSMGQLTYRSNAVPATVLTPTEMKILEYLMRNNNIIISRHKLIEQIWGFDCVGDTNRVDVYIRRIRRKIESDPTVPKYLHTIRGIGYVFRVENTQSRQYANNHHQ